MALFALFLLSLATWRLSHLLVHEDGPWDLAARLRYGAGVRYDENSERYADTMVGKLLLCVWCTSIWVGLGFTLLYLFLPPLVWQLVAWPLALSAGAIGIEKIEPWLAKWEAS